MSEMLFTGASNRNSTTTQTTVLFEFQDAYSFCEMSAQKHLRDVTERLIFPFESELTSVIISFPSLYCLSVIL